MKVIRHQPMESDQPGLRFRPSLPQTLMHQRLSQPTTSISGYNRYEDNGRIARMDTHSRSWMPPPDVSIVRSFGFHAPEVMGRDKRSRTDF
jgi:hypothetical protein